jgi:hypothetical protein
MVYAAGGATDNILRNTSDSHSAGDLALGHAQRMAGVSLLSAALAGAGEAMKHSSTATVAPILVNCVPSDGSEGGSISAWRRSSSSSAGGAASVAAAITKQHSCEPDTATEAVPATRISQADVQAGNFKTGVRYCIETWPQSKLLLVRSSTTDWGVTVWGGVSALSHAWAV